jgi:hypothetical protein
MYVQASCPIVAVSMKAMSDELRGWSVLEAGEGVMAEAGALFVAVTAADEETDEATLADEGRFKKMVVGAAEALLEVTVATEARDVLLLSVATLLAELTATGTELTKAGWDAAATVTLLKPAGTSVATAGEDVIEIGVEEGVTVTTIVVTSVTVATPSSWELVTDGVSEGATELAKTFAARR